MSPLISELLRLILSFGIFAVICVLIAVCRGPTRVFRSSNAQLARHRIVAALAFLGLYAGLPVIWGLF
jgi:hypothetical protein